MSDEHYTKVYLNAIKTCEELEKIQDNKIKKLEKRLEVSKKEHYWTLEQLRIATKALKEYADKDKWEHCSPDWRDAEEALKEMEGVK